MLVSPSFLFRTREQLEAVEWTLEGNVFRQEKQKWMPIFEGKMVGMYDHRAASIELHSGNALRQQQPAPSNLSDHVNASFVTIPYLWSSEFEGRSRTLSNWKREWFPVFKRVTASTSERLLVVLSHGLQLAIHFTLLRVCQSFKIF